MSLSYDTTAILVADRRSAREAAARRHRLLASLRRRAHQPTAVIDLRAAPTGPSHADPAIEPAETGRTPVEAGCRAA